MHRLAKDGLAPLAQSAERTTFNRVVVGSSPTRGAGHVNGKHNP